VADLVMRKRPAMHAGELGLFIDAQVFEEDFSNIRTGVDLQAKITQPHNLKQFRLAWALAAKIAQSGALGDADRREVMDYLLKKCKHVKYIYNKHRGGEELEVVPKSIRWSALEQDAFNRLFNRMIYVVITNILPDVPEGVIRDEIEKMAGINTPEPEAKPTPRRRGRPSNPKPVSIIPPHDPETGEVIEIPADEPVAAGDVPNQSGPAAPDEPPLTVQPTNSVPAPEPVTTPTVPSPPPAEPAPPPPAPAAAQAPITKDFTGWRAYALGWLAQYRADPHATDQDVMVRWNAERGLRNECGITSADRQPVSEVYLTIVEEKRNKGKPI
jgi:hypothetical protein